MTLQEKARQHPTPELWIAYVYDRDQLDVKQTESAEAHLIGCSECQLTLKGVRALLDPADEGEDELPSEEIQRHWARFSQRLRSAHH